MDNSLFTFCMLGLFLLLIVGISQYMRRNRPAPPGTYDDPNMRSGGSIGGEAGRPTQRTYDDPNLRSGGSIGGGNVRSYDDPDIQSGGSFGGSGGQSSSSPRRSDLDNRAARPSRPAAPPPPPSSRSGPERPRHDDPDIRSGGSFGG